MRVPRLRMCVLGSLRVEAGGVDVTPGAPKLRTVLALLVMREGRLVPSHTIVRELWEDQPPRSAVGTVQTYVLQLRKLLAAALGVAPEEIARSVLTTRPGGYCLQLDAGESDLGEFTRLIADGRAALADGRPDDGVRLLQDAVGLWEGAALADVPFGPTLSAKVCGLEERHLHALETMIETEMQIGADAESSAMLASLTAENPLHEGFHKLYMVALQRNGRRAQALQVFRSLRRNLVDELGVEPGSELQSLHRMILA